MATVTRYVETAAENGAQVISLPEMWNCPYSNDYFREYAETEDGPTVKFLSDLAAKHDIYLIGGSIPELDGGKVYNTSFSFDRSGQIIGKHRKVHLFDINVKGGIRFMESEDVYKRQAVTKTVALRKILTERCSYAERASVKRTVKITSEPNTL